MICRRCGRTAPLDDVDVLSTHWTTDGVVVYYRCVCGRANVGLV